jgi:hypothetical protein
MTTPLAFATNFSKYLWQYNLGPLPQKGNAFCGNEKSGRLA